MIAQLHASWLAYLNNELNEPYMQSLMFFLQQQKKQNKIIFPPDNMIFNALNQTPLNAVNVVILGQDPYHGVGQAHGLAFSVPDEVKPPPSLVNIYKELRQDLSINNHSGNLTDWAKQGVLLLNSVLTVEQAMAGSHRKIGWEKFTDKIIQLINDHCDAVVFMLWGAYAQKKGQLVNGAKHLVLHAPHPSPLSAYKGFIGCQHFSLCNQYLLKNHKKTINWQL